MFHSSFLLPPLCQFQVFELAEKTAELYRRQQEQEKVAREKAARTIVHVSCIGPLQSVITALSSSSAAAAAAAYYSIHYSPSHIDQTPKLFCRALGMVQDLSIVISLQALRKALSLS